MFGERIECSPVSDFVGAHREAAARSTVDGEATVGSGAFHHGSASSIGAAGTSVATETCGHVSVAKFSDTFWVYWICG